MGFDGLISFLIRNLPNDTFDEVNLNNNYNKLVSKNVLIDISFILYNCYTELENDINLILKYIYALSCTDYNKIIQLIECEIKKEHWKDFNVPLDGETQDEISDKFINFLVENENEVFFKILSIYTCKKLENILENLFETEFISDIVLFFDSIPSYSKILEQRKRRMKNYLESQNRKEYYIKYFSDLENDNVKENEIEYDYFSWLKKKFNCNKIIDSNSTFVKNLKYYIINNININKIKIKVDEEQFGEADYKIFKYISQNKLVDKITILSCDSDLVYQLMLQQHNYLYNNNKVSLNLFKFYINSFDYCQYFNANKILDHINSNYLEVNNIKDQKKNYFFLDFLLILNFFGNDFLPSSLEIGPEISFNILIKTHFNALNDKNGGIIVLNTKKNGYKINFENLKLWLIELSKNSSFTKIILLRYYKVPYQITYILTDRLNLSLIEIKQKLLEPYLIYKGYVNNDEIFQNDIRKILYKKYLKDNPNEVPNSPFPKFNNNNLISYLNQLDDLLENYLDYMDLENLGLKNNSCSIELDKNMYQNLYNFILNESYISKNIKNLSFDLQIEKVESRQIKDYLLMLHFIVVNFFNDMEFYKSTNLTRYPYKNIPSLDCIINFLNINEGKNLEVEFNKIIESNILKKEKYFDSILHHLIITPYLLDSNYIDLLENKELLKKIIKNFNDKLNIIWANSDNDEFDKIDPKILLKEWSDILYKINQQNKLESRSNLLIDL